MFIASVTINPLNLNSSRSTPVRILCESVAGTSESTSGLIDSTVAITCTSFKKPSSVKFYAAGKSFLCIMKWPPSIEKRATSHS